MRQLTPEQANKLEADQIRFFGEMHRRHKKCLDMYNLDFHVLKDKAKQGGVHEVIPATARILVESVAAHVKPRKFDIRFEPMSGSEASAEQADMLEAAGHEILERYSLVKGYSPFTEVTKNVAISGLSALRCLYDPNRWGEKPERKEGESKDDFNYRMGLFQSRVETRLPFSLKAVDSLNMLPDIQEPMRFMFERYSVKPFYLGDDFPNLQDSDQFVPKQISAFWSDAPQWMYLVGGQKAESVKATGQNDQNMGQYFDPVGAGIPKNIRPTDFNPYGIIPYTLVWSGQGKNSPFGNPEDKAVGLIYPLISLLKEEARSLTAISIILQVTAMPRFLMRDTPKEGLDIAMQPGASTDIGKALVEPFPEMRVPPDLYNLQNIIQQQMELYVGSKILSGARPTGVTSALFEEILMEQAKNRYQTFIQSLEQAFSNVMAQMLYIWENVIKEPIPGIRLKPEKIKGHYRGHIDFKYEDIAEKRIKAMIANMLFQGGLYNFEQSHELMGTEDITGARKGLLKDQIFKDPRLIAALGQQAIEDLGFDKLMQRVMANQTGQPPVDLSNMSNWKPSQDVIKQLGGPMEQRVSQPGFSGGGMGGGEGVGQPEALGV
jgi:hypothetical protein